MAAPAVGGQATIIARSAPGPEDLSEPTRFAWEVLRRLGTYAGEPAEILTPAPGPTVLLLRAPPPKRDWGLSFCRGSQSAREPSTAFLAGRPRRFGDLGHRPPTYRLPRGVVRRRSIALAGGAAADPMHRGAVHRWPGGKDPIEHHKGNPARWSCRAPLPARAPASGRPAGSTRPMGCA